MRKLLSNSEQIVRIEDAIKQGQALDVSKLRHFLLHGADIPLYCVGSGGFSLSMRFCALLYSANKGMGQARTPLMMNHISDETLKHCKVLLYSKGGSQVDTGFVCHRMMKINPQGLAGIGGYGEKEKYPNTMINQIREVSDNWTLFNWKTGHSFVSLISPFVMSTAIYRAFTDEKEPLRRLKLNSESIKNYTYCTKGGDTKNLPQLKDIKTFICLYGGWGEPVAYTMESIFTEAGAANVQLCDVRNWCHGRFMFLSNHIEDSALVLLLSPREKQYVQRLLDARYKGIDIAFPDNILIITVETDFDEPLATLDLAVKNVILINDIMHSYGEDFTEPKNLSHIDKRVPRPLKMKEQLEFGSVNLNVGKVGTLKGVSRKQVIKYNPRLTVKRNAEKNGVSEATIRLYIKQNHIDRERDCQLLIFLKVHRIINDYPQISYAELARKVKCNVVTARKYAAMTTFDISVKEGHVSLVHDDTL